jgi:hypothetical protein
MYQQARTLQNPPVFTSYCYPIGNDTAVDDCEWIRENYDCSGPAYSSCDSQASALARAQAECPTYPLPLPFPVAYVAVTFWGGQDNMWIWSCCQPEGESAGAAGAGATRELRELQRNVDDDVPSNDQMVDDPQPTAPPDDGYLCYNVTDQTPVSCDDVILGGSCHVPPGGYCAATRTDAFEMAPSRCPPPAVTPYLVLVNSGVEDDECLWAFQCCTVPPS